MAEAGKAGTGLEKTGASGTTSLLQRALAAGQMVRARVMDLPATRRRNLGIALLLVGALGSGILWYADRPDWRVLFSGLDAKDVQQIAQELSAAGIAYELTDDGGGVKVNADQVDKARMEIAAKGMPQSGRMGFELFDKPNWVGSEFDEKVNYQRALEGELEHTIGTLSAVRSARVHIVLAKESLFAQGERAAKASVVLRLRRTSMPTQQADSIRALVAGAVDNLSPQEVALVDADGRLNLNSPGRGEVAGEAERALEEKLVAMLEPTAGRDNVRATVNVIYDDGSMEKTDEVYDPEQVATLTMHKSQQTLAPVVRAAGVPGTASNTPGAAVPGSVQAAATPTTGASASPGSAPAVPPLLQNAPPTGQRDPGLPVYPLSGMQGGGQSGTDETATYAVTRHLQHQEEGPGRIQRVTAAVLVNDRSASEGAGKLAHAVWKPRSADEMLRLQQLARAAVGFNAARGDQVVIENVAFSSNAPEAAVPIMDRLGEETSLLLHSQPGLLKELGVLALGILLVMTVLRPVTQQMMAVMKMPLALSASHAGASGPEALHASASEADRVEGSVTGRFGLNGQRSEMQGIHERVTEHIRREPAQSIRLLESWIGAPAGDKQG